MVHEQQIATDIDPNLLNDIISLVNQQCANCQPPDATGLEPQINGLLTKYKQIWKDGGPRFEAAAHAISNPEYLALTAGIRSRAQSSNWPAQCQ